MNQRLLTLLMLAVLALPLPVFLQEQDRPEILISRAFEYLREGNLGQAVATGRQGLRIVETEVGPDHEKAAETQASVAFIELRAGNASQAETLFRKAIQTRERVLATDTLPLAIACCGLAQTLQSVGNTVDAERLFRKTVDLLDRSYPDGHQQMAIALEALGNILSATERTSEAETLVTRALAIRERLLGKGNAQLAGSLNALALVYRRAGRFDAAAAQIQRIIELLEPAVGSGSATLMDPLLNLADCLDSCEQYARAEPAYRRAIALQEQHLGSQSFELAFTLKSLAMNRLCAGNMPEAESLLERSGGIFALASESFQLEIGSIDFMLGSFAQARGLFRKAKDLYQACLEIREKSIGPDHPDTGAALNNLADIELQLGELDAAWRHAGEALRIREASLGAGHRMTHIAMNNLAAILVAMNRNAEAEALFTTLLHTLEEKPDANADAIAILTNNLGELYRKIGRYRESEEMCRKAWDMRRKRHGEDALETASSLSSLAASMEMNGRYAEAEAAFKKALDIKFRRLGENHPEVATVKSNLASLYESLSRFSEAESLLQSALTIRRKALGEDHPASALLMCRLGAFLFDLGRTESGIRLQERGCEILETRLGAGNPDRGTALCNLGACYARLDRFDHAERALSEGIKIASSSLGMEHPNVATGLNQLSIVMHRQGKTSRALSLLERARVIQEKSLGPDHPDLGITFTNLGIIQMETGNDGIARKYLERGASILKNSVGRTDLNYIGCIESLAQLDDRQGRFLEGIRRHLQAVSLEEENAVRNRSEQYSLVHRVRQTVPLTGFLSSLAKLARHSPSQARPFEETAFELIESCRSRRFIEQMSRLSAARMQGIPDAILQRMRESNACLQKTGQLLRDERRKSRRHRNLELVRTLEDRFGVQLREQMALDKALSHDFPAYATFAWPGRITVEQVRRNLLREDELLLEFWEGDGYLHAAVIGRNEYRFVSHEIGSDSLRLKILNFRESIKTMSDLTTFKSAAAGLAREILLPFLGPSDLSGISRLIIIPSGFLANVPFEALILTDAGNDFYSLDYFFKKLSISYIPSASILKEIRRSTASSGVPRNASEPILLFGDPAYSPAKPVSSGTSAFGKSGPAADEISPAPRLAPLPGTRKEVEMLSEIYYGKPNAPNARLGADASESFIKQASANGVLGTFHIIHFAVHGIIPGEIQGLSEPCLALSTVGDAPEDGFLNMSEIFDLRINAALIVLSACNTGIVDVALPNLEALSCFARAFFYAGANRLLLTLWSISDAGTAEFMRFFHTSLKNSGRPLEALTEARKFMLTSPAFSHPFFWAPFILLGP